MSAVELVWRIFLALFFSAWVIAAAGIAYAFREQSIKSSKPGRAE